MTYQTKCLKCDKISDEDSLCYTCMTDIINNFTTRWCKCDQYKPCYLVEGEALCFDCLISCETTKTLKCSWCNNIAPYRLASQLNVCLQCLYEGLKVKS